jgi:3-oxoacyl-[acyl-carrier protein] reductase
MSFTAILGASGTIGSCLAHQLVRDGQQVLLLGRDSERLAELAGQLGQPWAVIDPGASVSVEEVIAARVTSHGPCAAIVNAIGSVLLKPAHSTSDSEFREVIETNLFTSFSAVRAAGRLMRENGGSVLLFASAAATIGIPNHEAIAAAKAGIVGLARSAAATYAGSNIRFNVISPGLVKTNLTQRIWNSPLAAAASQEMHALGRLGEPEQVASLAKWLIDPANDWMTGQVIGLDGGLGSVLPVRKVPRPS